MSVKEKGLAIIAATKPLIVNTIGLDGYPNTRIFYSQANDGYTIYFSSGANAAKVSEIAANSKVSAYYENTAQEITTWKNVVVYGDASPLVKEDSDYEKALSLLSQKSPRFKKRVEDGLLHEMVIYKITPRRVKVLDYASEPRVEQFELGVG